MIKVTLIILFTLFEVNFCTGVFKKNIEADDNFINDINKYLQDITGVITSLKSKRNFTDQCVTRLLLPMFATLNKYSNRTHQIHKAITNASQLNIEFNLLQNTSLFKIDKLVTDIITKNIYLKNNTNATLNDINITWNYIDILGKSGEMATLLRKYLTNVNSSRLLDLENPSQIILELYEKYKSFKRRNSNVWEPSKNSIKLLRERNTKIDDFPFVASVLISNASLCSGAIIGKKIIITAASCFQESFNDPDYLQNDPGSISVRVGSDYPDRLGDTIYVTDIFIHPKFDLGTLRNNIAIIKTNKNFKFNIKCKKITRNNKLTKILPKSVKEVIILGWGSKDNPTLINQSDTLTYSVLNVMHEAKECLKCYGKNFALNENFCAGFNKTDAGAYQRDIGSPAIVGNKLVGLVSFGPPKCGTSDAPIVLTYVAFFNKWINSVIKNITQNFVPANITITYKYKTHNDSKDLNHTISPENMELATKPDSHLWITTTVDMLHHSLVNKSLLIDYNAIIGTDPPKVEITTTNKPVEEVMIEYYKDKTIDNTHAISAEDVPNGTKKFRRRLAPLNKMSEVEVRRSKYSEHKNNMPSFTKKFRSIISSSTPHQDGQFEMKTLPTRLTKVDKPYARKNAYLNLHNTLTKRRIWTPPHLKYRILKDFTAHRTTTVHRSDGTQHVKALRHSKSPDYLTRKVKAADEDSRYLVTTNKLLTQDIKTNKFPRKPPKNSRIKINHSSDLAMSSKSRNVKDSINIMGNYKRFEENYPENDDSVKLNEYLFLLRQQTTKRNKKENNIKNLLPTKNKVPKIGSNMNYDDALENNIKYKANVFSSVHRASGENEKSHFEEQRNQNIPDTDMIMNDMTTQTTHKQRIQFNNMHSYTDVSKTAKHDITKISEKVGKQSLEDRTQLSKKSNELQKILILILDRELSFIDEQTQKDKNVNLQSNHKKDVNKKAANSRVTDATYSYQLNTDKKSLGWENYIFEKRKQAHKTTKWDREFHVDQILRNLDITTPKHNSIIEGSDNDSLDYSSKPNRNILKMLAPNNTNVEDKNAVSKLHINMKLLATTNINSADSYHINPIQNKPEYEDSYSYRRRSGSRLSSPNFLDYIDF